MAVISELALFKDILPLYKISLLDPEKEKGVNISKEVRLLRKYEAGLLKSYQEFLKHCEDCIIGFEKSQEINIHVYA